MSYNRNGGTGSLPSEHTDRYKGDDINIYFDLEPSRSGYVFLGWDPDTRALDPQYARDICHKERLVMDDTDIMLYALWRQENSVLFSERYEKARISSAETVSFFSKESISVEEKSDDPMHNAPECRKQLAATWQNASEGGFYYSSASDPVDLSAYAKYGAITFWILHKDEMAGLSHLEVEISSGEDTNKQGGSVELFSSYTPISTKQQWKRYRIPLQEFNAFGQLPNFAALTRYLAFKNPQDANGNAIANGTLYFDDVYFVGLPKLVMENAFHQDPAKLILKQEQSHQLNLKFILEDQLANRDIDVTNSASWSSSDDSIATVSDSGLVDTVNIGTATITGEHKEFSVSIEIKVEAK